MVTLVSNPNLFTQQPAVAPNGTLTYQTAPFADGGVSVTVVAVDNGGTANGGSNASQPFTFDIHVTPINQAPSFTKGPDQSTVESATPSVQTVPGWATSIAAGPAAESGQTVNFLVVNNNNALFAVQPTVNTNGTLSYEVAPPPTAVPRSR